jgi:hypothetical protein
MFGMTSTQRRDKSAWLSLMVCIMAGMLLCTGARASENSGCAYPVGAETVLQGMMPAPHATGAATFSLFITANKLDQQGAPPVFHLRVFGNALKIEHNWGVPVLGGMLVSTVAVPVLYEQLRAGGSYEAVKVTQFGLSNVLLAPLGIAYHKGNWHGFYQVDFYPPGAPYSKTAELNVGQHNMALSPVGAFTYLSGKAKWEVSSKVNYIVNFRDGATKYRSGNELTWEYTAMRAISKKAAIGFNGYLYQQITGDQSNGVGVAGGNKGRDLAVGPQLRVFFGKHCAFAVKYFRDTLVENKPRGDGFWFETGFPLNFGKHE